MRPPPLPRLLTPTEFAASSRSRAAAPTRAARHLTHVRSRCTPLASSSSSRPSSSPSPLGSHAARR
eukprot:4302220-Prymnesium_polylepis.1